MMSELTVQRRPTSLLKLDDEMNFPAGGTIGMARTAFPQSAKGI
jgi:hypothetical protein